jgi:hypothetical protein
MKHYRDLKDLFYGIDAAFEYEFSPNKPYFNGVCSVTLSEENEIHLDETASFGNGEIAMVYVYFGYLTLKYSGKYILRYLLKKINEALIEVEENYKNFDLTEEEQIEILSITKQVKEGLPKLKIFETSTELIDLERREYLESQ